MTINENVGSSTAALTNASNDTSSIINDSVVWFLCCSGVLISSRIVLTAGHCIDSNNYIDVGSRRKVWEWVDLTSSININFGNDRDNPTLTATASKYSQSGHVDMVMLLLDNPVPTDIAIPSRPLTRIPLDGDIVRFLRRKDFIMSGWGAGTSLRQFRQTAPAKYGRYPFAPFGVENHVLLYRCAKINRQESCRGLQILAE